MNSWIKSAESRYRYSVQGFGVCLWSGITIEAACAKVKESIRRGSKRVVVWEFDDDRKIELHCPPFCWRCECNCVSFKGSPCNLCGKAEPIADGDI